MGCPGKLAVAGVEAAHDSAVGVFADAASVVGHVGVWGQGWGAALDGIKVWMGWQNNNGRVGVLKNSRKNFYLVTFFV